MPATEALGTEGRLRSMSTKGVRRLYTRARSIRTLCFFWLLAIAMSVLLMYAAPPGSVTIFIAPAFVVLAAVAAFGTWRYEPWGRYLSIALCIAILAVFPWGTLFGVLGLFALIGSKALFGTNRISQEQLHQELQYRKANNVA